MSTEYVIKQIKNGLKDYEAIFKKNGVMVAGGVFTSLFTQGEVNDVDCYFRSKKDLVSFLAEMAEMSHYPYLISVTDKSMTLSADGYPTIQLIYFSYFDSLDEVFECFDFTISMCGYDYAHSEDGKGFHHHPDFFSDISQRRLCFNPKTSFPLISGIRVNKFRERGFSISRSQMMKVMLAVSKIKITTVEEFVNQVGGMYGNAALTLLTDSKDFDLDSAMEKLASIENESQINLLLPRMKTVYTGTESMPLNLMANILMAEKPFSGGWYRKERADGKVCAMYDNGGWRHLEISLSIALLFAKDQERFANEEDANRYGMFYKYVKKTDDPLTFRSFYDPKFTYELGKLVTSEGKGIFVASDTNIKNHRYSRQEDAVLLACSVKMGDFIQNDVCNDYTTKALYPVAIITDPYNLTKSPTPYQEIPIETSPEINNECIGEDEIREAFEEKVEEQSTTASLSKIVAVTPPWVGN